MSLSSVLESLESRFLFSFTTPIDRTLISGTDRLTLRLAGDTVELVDRKGNIIESELAATVTSIAIVGRADQKDELTIDFKSGGAFGLPGGVTYDGGSGSGNDRVTLLGESAGGSLGVSDKIVSFRDNFELTTTGVEQLDITTGKSADVLAVVTAPAFEKINVVDAGGDDTYQLLPTGGVLNIDDKKKGFDALDFRLAASAVTANLGKAAQTFALGTAQLKVKGAIEAIYGSDFADTLTGNSAANLIIAGDGNDSVTGGGGSDILIGGAGVDSLGGDGGTDILIGGSTDFDVTPATLKDVLTPWGSGKSFATRFDRVRFPIDAADAVYLINGPTVTDDGSVDQLDGGPGKDVVSLGTADGTVTNVELTAAPVLPVFDPANFSDPLTINNPFLPLVPGTIFTSEATVDGQVEQDVFEVLSTSRSLAGIEVREVRDRGFVDNVLMEDTIDLFAQDDFGNVWYMGEDTTSFKYDKRGNLKSSSISGSWHAGQNGALPGFAMEASPTVGDAYYQEFAPLDDAIDQAAVSSTTDNVTIGLGSFSNVLVTDETTDLEPGVHESKFYVVGTGQILTHEDLDKNGVPAVVLELISVTPPV